MPVVSEAAIQIEGVTKRYGSITALSNVTLNISQGEIFGLLGPNGSGKSTLTKSMLGLVVPDSGRISMLGKSPSDSRYDIGYVPEEIILYDSLSVVEFLISLLL
jgi:ABC-type multidrug transport system, ATPase component